MEDLNMNKQELVKVQEQKRNQLNALPFGNFMNQQAMQNRILKTLGSDRGQRFITGIVSAVNNNSDLAKCTNDSIYSGALLGESLNLSPSPQLGHYYLVPYGDKAQFQLGYKGYIQLAIRSGYYTKMNVIAIKEDELINYDPLNEVIEVNLIQDEEERENAQTTGYYAMFEYKNGFKKTLYWSKNKMIAHAKKYSQGYKKDLEKGTKYTFWSKDFDGMAFKTMLRQLISKWGIMSIEMQEAVDKDMAVLDEKGNPIYVDNQTEKIVIEQEELTEVPKGQEKQENSENNEIQEIKQVNINDL